MWKDEGNHCRCLSPSKGPVSKSLDFVDRSAGFHLESKSHDVFNMLGVSSNGDHIAEDLVEVHGLSMDDIVPFTVRQFQVSCCHKDQCFNGSMIFSKETEQCLCLSESRCKL